MTAHVFTLGDEIGRGALGRVVKVHDKGRGDISAGKILHDTHQHDAKARIRFISEAEVSSRLHHENIVQGYGIEVIDGESVMRMELVDGPSLATYLAIHGPLAEEQILKWGRSIASGLRAAHLAGFVHRDLKPQNILITPDDVPKIADFGMARAASFAGVDESAFAVAGTPDYMAPECVDPLAVDARTDLYSLGCIFHEMASGHPPYRGATAFAILESHRNAPIPDLTGNFSVPLKALIKTLLAKSPADRLQSAAAVEQALVEIGSGKSALVTVQSRDIAASGCSACGQPLMPGITICFSCGNEQLSLDKGAYSLFVIGPGKTGDKFDAELRSTLLDWLHANPKLNLDTEHLSQAVPRLPFVLAKRISKPTAIAVATSLQKLGLQMHVGKGGAMRLAAMRKKTVVLSGRMLAIAATSLVYMTSSMTDLGLALIPLLGVGSAVTVGISGYRSSRQITKHKKAIATVSLPPLINRAMEEVTPVLANMQLRRHRENLRGIVERVVKTCNSLPVAMLQESEEDLARLLRMSLIASARTDEIEVSIENLDMRNPTPTTLLLMRERDRWAGRLLEITAFLDAMRVRSLALKYDQTDLDDNKSEQLEELRSHIAALEEIQVL